MAALYTVTPNEIVQDRRRMSIVPKLLPVDNWTIKQRIVRYRKSFCRASLEPARRLMTRN
jgi:hypothetical protein